jgi:hypothetical protein
LLKDSITRLTTLDLICDPAIFGWRCDAAALDSAAWLDGLGQ